MKPNIKNILIGVLMLGVLIVAYFMFIKKAPTDATLTSSSGITTTDQNTDSSTSGLGIGQDFISLLLSVKSIKLNDSIFSDPAFLSLKDSSILLMLVDDGSLGRPNPFAPIGSDIAPASYNSNVSVDNSVPVDNTNNSNSGNSQKSANTTSNSVKINNNNVNPAAQQVNGAKTGA